MSRENDVIWTAAEEANRKFGQWMPQLWIEIFIKELASTPPATPAGVGADEIRSACIEHASLNMTVEAAHQQADRITAAILALLSRAGDQK